MPARKIRKVVGKKSAAAKKSAAGKNRLPYVLIPKYKMPKTRKGFDCDAQIGKYLIEEPDAMTKRAILEKFGIDEKTFNARARMLAPIILAGEKRDFVNVLLEMGRDTALRKGGLRK